MTSKVPVLTNDEEAEAFLERDLSQLDFSQFKPAQFEFQAKNAQINMRVPAGLLDEVKRQAQEQGIPYQRFIRQTLEKAVAGRRR